MSDPLYRIAQQVTDEVLGEGSYARLNRDNPDPAIQATIQGRQERSATVDPAAVDALLTARLRARLRGVSEEQIAEIDAFIEERIEANRSTGAAELDCGQ